MARRKSSESISSIKILAALAALVLAAGFARSALALPLEPSAGDRAFAVGVAQSGAAQVAEARLALTNSERGDIRDFAQDLLDDHAVSDAELRQIAATGGVNLPQATADDIAGLAKLRGEAFDRRYVADAETAIGRDITAATREGREGVNPGLQYYAAHRLARLKAEQRIIEQIAVGSTVGVEPPAPSLGWQYQPPPLAR